MSYLVQISARSRACPRLFGPEAVIEVVVLRELVQPPVVVHGVTLAAEQHAWFAQPMVDFAVSFRAVGGCW